MNRTAVRVGFCATIVSLLLFAIPVMAGQTSITIKSGTLQEALDEYSKVTGIKLVYLNELIEGKNSPGAQNASPEDALEQILQGTALTFQMADSNTAVLKEKKPTKKPPVVEPPKDKTEEPELEQTSIETITVTVNKIEEDLQDVPQNIMVIDDEILKEKGIRDIPDLINEIPNMTNRSAIDENVNFRGLNKALGNGSNPVVIYIDGVPYSQPAGFEASMNNVERIEVLRGPQGTLYGKDAIGGVIKIVTKEPKNQWHGNIGAEYGSYNDMEGSFNVNGPLVQDKLYVGLNARYQQDDGWITNDYKNDDKANKSENYNLGAFLLYKPTDRLSAKFILSNDSYEDHGYKGYALPRGAYPDEFDRDDAEHISVDMDTIYETETLAQSLYLKYEFDSMTLTSTTIHRNLKDESIRDKDCLAGTSNDGLVSYVNQEFKIWAEELRLSSNNTEGVRWVAGAYFEVEDYDTSPTMMQFNRSGTSWDMSWYAKRESKTMAVFGQTMIPFGDRFELTLGTRYQYIDKKVDSDYTYAPTGVSSDPTTTKNDKDWDAFVSKAALLYRLSDNWNSYLSIAQGYVPGGLTAQASRTKEENTFDPQTSIDYEIGVKGELTRARIAAAIFYMDIRDTQFNRYDADLDKTVADNAGKSHSLGAELELTYFLTDTIELTAALGVIEAEYDDYDDGKLNWDGESIPHTPSYSGRIGAAYYHPNGFYARGDVRSQGEVPYYDTPNAEFNELDSYITADAKIGYRFKGYDIYAYCNNLTDEEYMTALNTGGKTLGIYGDPRTFGIGIRYSF